MTKNEMDLDFETPVCDSRGFENFNREISVYCGELYREVDIVPIAAGQMKYYKCGRSRAKLALTAPAQRSLNDRRARRWLVQVANTNFSVGDYSVTYTYDGGNLPDSADDAEHIVTLALARLARFYKKRGAELRYLLVTAYAFGRKSERPVRIHHHIIVNGAPGISREDAENVWRLKYCKASDDDGCGDSVFGRGSDGKNLGRPIGTANADSLQPDLSGIAKLASYLKRQPSEKSRKRWRGSQNLIKPRSPEPVDDKWTRREVERIAGNRPTIPDVRYWERKYPGWTLQPEYAYSYAVRHNPISGTAIYLKLVRVDAAAQIAKKRKKSRGKAVANVGPLLANELQTGCKGIAKQLQTSCKAVAKDFGADCKDAAKMQTSGSDKPRTKSCGGGLRKKSNDAGNGANGG